MHRIIAVALALSLTACASPGATSLTGGETPESVLDGDTHARTMYDLLVAEIAGQRGDVKRAAKSYVAAAQQSSDPAVAERAARVALYAKDADLARAAAERWLELSPEAIEAHRVLALLALQNEDADTAYQQLKAALPEDDASLEQALAAMGALIAQQAPGDTAVAAVQHLARDYPESRMAQYVEAQVALKSQNPAVALKAADRALALSPGWRSARLLRVDALLAQKRTDEALGMLRDLLAESPRDYDLRLQFAHTLVDLSRPEEALSQFERLIGQRPDDDRVLYAASLLAIELHADEKASAWLERLLSMNARTDAASFYLGRLAERNGDFEAARRHYERAGGNYNQDAQLRLAVMQAREGEVAAAVERLKQLRSDNPQSAVDSWAVQGELLRNAGRLRDSVDVYTDALGEHPETTDLLYGRAMTWVAMGRVPEAESDLRAILSREPTNANALNALGYTLADETSRYDEAERLIKKAYSQQPRDPAIIDSMGWVAYRQGRLDDAERYLREAYQLAPQPEIAAHLGEVLWQRGRRDKAREVWHRALKANPGDTTLQDTMERLLP